MVFSFFKKEPKKMIARPAVVPRGKEVKPDTAPAEGRANRHAGSSPKPAAPASAPLKEVISTLDGSSFVFSETSLDFQIEADIDPIDAEAEEAAILFANGQDEAARVALENALRIHGAGVGERLWLMLFDLYQLIGEKAPFDALGVEYARSFEKSPPGWYDKSEGRAQAPEALPRSVLFKGPLTGGNDAAFAAVRQALEKTPRLRVDVSQLRDVDAAGCGRLLNLVHQARKARRDIELLGREALRALLEQRIETGCAAHEECWLMLLELYQMQGQHELFEEMAINYAVTFEVSPPSWEVSRVAAPEPARKMVAEPAPVEFAVGTYVLRGDIKAMRFGDLPERTAASDPVLIDCADLTRIDFISAGALLNALTTVRRTGKQIVFRHPNHLVAELFGVVGLKAVATILLAKR